MKKNIILIILLFFSINYIFSQKVIEMTYDNGIYTIPCKVNGIPMKFIFDTGASDVSISLTEAKFLLKQGLLDEKDIKGSVKYKIANGEIEKGTKIILREINIDGIILNNVEASIVHELDAPLLLGQSAISKLGTFQLDGNKLIIQTNKDDGLEFLGIDLTKNSDDFGISRASLKKTLLPINFNDLKISKNHFLENFKFDIQKIVFDNKGNVAMIILHKKTFGDYSKKEKKSKEIYHSLIKKIDNKYWVSKSKKERKTIWKSNLFDILLNIDNNKSINLIYVPYILTNLNSGFFENEPSNLKVSSDLNPIKNSGNHDIKKDKRSKKEFEKKIVENSRDFILSNAKYILNKGKYDDNSFKGGIYENENLKEITFPRIENDNLVIYFDRKYKKISPSKFGNGIFNTENRLINGFCYDAFSVYFGSSKSSIDIINMCKFKNIIFIFDIIYADENSRTIKKTIKLKRNKLNLNFPYTKSEFIKLLK